MLVKNWMSHPAITIDVEAYIKEASNLMEAHHIRGLPVMRDGRLVGYITDKDIKRASASEVSRLENAPEIYRMITNVKVRKFMTKNPTRIPINCTISKAAEIMLKSSLLWGPKKTQSNLRFSSKIDPARSKRSPTLFECLGVVLKVSSAPLISTG